MNKRISRLALLEAEMLAAKRDLKFAEGELEKAETRLKYARLRFEACCEALERGVAQ